MSSQPDVKPRLHQSHEADFCSTLLNSLDAIIWEADATTFQFQFVSHQAERILGYPAEQWITQPDFWRQHTHPDDVEWCSAFCRDSTARGTDHVFEYRMISADHRVVWLRDVVTIVRGAEERPLLRGLMLDITEHKQAEEQLRKSEERFRTLANHVREVFWISALGGTEMLYVSPAYESIWGMSCDSLYQNPRSFLDPIVPEDRERTLKACESGRERDFEVEFRIRKPDGSVRWIRDRGFPLRDRSGQVYAVGGLA
jgi:PAS domain S-box-containing protein